MVGCQRAHKKFLFGIRLGISIVVQKSKWLLFLMSQISKDEYRQIFQFVPSNDFTSEPMTPSLSLKTEDICDDCSSTIVSATYRSSQTFTVKRSN